MNASVLVVLAAILASGAVKPAAYNGPISVTIVNGRMAVNGSSFQGVADHVEWDAAKASVTQTGQNGAAAVLTYSQNGHREVVKARKIIFSYAAETISVEGAQSATSGPN